MIHSEDCEPQESEKRIQIIEAMIGRRVSWAYSADDGYELLDRLQTHLDREREIVDGFADMEEQLAVELNLIPLSVA